MTVTAADVHELLSLILAERGRPALELDETRPLQDAGYGLDSTDTLTFSTLLEEQYGLDPYSANEFPHTVAEVVAFYART